MCLSQDKLSETMIPKSLIVFTTGSSLPSRKNGPIDSLFLRTQPALPAEMGGHGVSSASIIALTAFLASVLEIDEGQRTIKGQPSQTIPDRTTLVYYCCL